MATKTATKKPAAMKPAADLDASNEEAKSNTDEKPVSKSSPPPNVIWRSKKEPPQVRIGDRVLDMPSAEIQREGFYHPEAGNIRRAHTNYKLIKSKG